MTAAPAIRAEAAHQARRDGRAVVATEAWPFEHRPLSEAVRAELAAAADRAGRRVEAAAERAVTP